MVPRGGQGVGGVGRDASSQYEPGANRQGAIPRAPGRGGGSRAADARVFGPAPTSHINAIHIDAMPQSISQWTGRGQGVVTLETGEPCRPIPPAAMLASLHRGCGMDAHDPAARDLSNELGTSVTIPL